MSSSERAAALPQWTRATSTWRDALLVTWAVARRDRFALAGLVIYGVLLVVALAAPVVAPYNPQDLNYRPDGEVAANEAPSLSHWLGTTNLGRDIFSQVLFGARAALVWGSWRRSGSSCSARWWAYSPVTTADGWIRC